MQVCENLKLLLHYWIFSISVEGRYNTIVKKTCQHHLSMCLMQLNTQINNVFSFFFFKLESEHLAFIMSTTGSVCYLLIISA